MQREGETGELVVNTSTLTGHFNFNFNRTFFIQSDLSKSHQQLIILVTAYNRFTLTCKVLDSENTAHLHDWTHTSCR